jgi:hypothetical protein
MSHLAHRRIEIGRVNCPWKELKTLGDTAATSRTRATEYEWIFYGLWWINMAEFYGLWWI